MEFTKEQIKLLAIAGIAILALIIGIVVMAFGGKKDEIYGHWKLVEVIEDNKKIDLDYIYEIEFIKKTGEGIIYSDSEVNQKELDKDYFKYSITGNSVTIKEYTDDTYEEIDTEQSFNFTLKDKKLTLTSKNSSYVFERK